MKLRAYFPFLAAFVLAVSLVAGTAQARENSAIDSVRQVIGRVIESLRYFLSTPQLPEGTITYSAPGMPSVTVEHSSFFSPALGMQRKYAVLLPPGYYENPQKRYPVVYLLNGLWGNENVWIVKGDLPRIYQEMLVSGKIRDIIIAMPDGENSAYENGCSGSIIFSCGNYEDYVVKDFIGEIDSKYRTMPDRSRRAIGGVSLGARGAMRLAFLHPDLFAFVAGHSGRYDFLVKDMTEESWEKIKESGLGIYFDHSINDLTPGYSESSVELHSVLTARGIPHDYEPVNFTYVESHAWTFWRQRVQAALAEQCSAICAGP